MTVCMVGCVLFYSISGSRTDMSHMTGMFPVITCVSHSERILLTACNMFIYIADMFIPSPDGNSADIGAIGGVTFATFARWEH